MKEWWLQLNQREQSLVGSLGSVLIVFLLYSLIWQPLNENIEQGQKKLDSRQALLSFVAQETARYKTFSGSGGANSSGSLSSVINQTARSKNISITRVQPQNSDIQVWIDNVAFSQLLNWLEELAKNEGIYVQNVDLGQTDEAGQVQVKRLQLGKGNE